MAKKKTTAITKAMSKTALISELAENTELSKKDIALVMDELALVIERHLKKRGAGTFTLPGLLKIRNVKKDAVKAHTKFMPLLGREVDIAAKPATTKIRVTPLKRLKEMPL